MKKNFLCFFLLLAGTAAGTLGTRKIVGGRAEENQKLSDKHLSLFLMMNQWVKVKQEGKNLASYFEQKGYHNIAVYGMSYAGKSFVNELEGSSIKIKYGIDQNADSIYTEIDIKSPDDELETVDAIVVTPVTFFTEIEAQMSRKTNCPIISLEDILYEI